MLTEKQFSQQVVDLARVFGWLVGRRPTWRRTGTYAGEPDLTLARRGVVLLVELKRDDGKLSASQEAWGAAAGPHWRCWRPRDWAEIVGELRRDAT
jgi:hypothetical protein